jgi:hypothetical protein
MTIQDSAADRAKKIFEKGIAATLPKYMKVRPYPRGIYLDKQSADELVFRLKAVHRRLRFLPLWIFLASLVLVPALGFWWGFDDGTRIVDGYRIPMERPDFSIVPTVILVLLTIAGLIWAWRIGHPKVQITATPDTIQVGNMIFNRSQYGGMRLGYQVQGEAVKIGTFDTVMGDHFMGVSGLRVAYGRWGEDLDYMVNKYHAAEYVVWMNEQIDAIGRPEPKKHDPAKGRKKAEF